MKQYFCVLNDEPAVLIRYNDGRIDGFVYTDGAWKKGFDADIALRSIEVSESAFRTMFPDVPMATFS